MQNAKKELTQKERRLDEERKTVRLEKDSAAFKHEADMKQLRSKEMTKLIIISAVCFLLGMAVAMFILKDSSTGSV